MCSDQGKEANNKKSKKIKSREKKSKDKRSQTEEMVSKLRPLSVRLVRKNFNAIIKSGRSEPFLLELIQVNYRTITKLQTRKTVNDYIHYSAINLRFLCTEEPSQSKHLTESTSQNTTMLTGKIRVKPLQEMLPVSGVQAISETLPCGEFMLHKLFYMYSQ